MCPFSSYRFQSFAVLCTVSTAQALHQLSPSGKEDTRKKF
uniref:Uncharacterized protein n=1 Tax=Anguilla anguilla TaxID=7936 RepID=A0A0E9QU62_ANGAN